MQTVLEAVRNQTCGSTIGIADFARRTGDLAAVVLAVCWFGSKYMAPTWTSEVGSGRFCMSVLKYTVPP